MTSEMMRTGTKRETDFVFNTQPTIMVILGRRDRQTDKDKEKMRDLFFNHDNQIFASKKPGKRPVIKKI